MNKLSDKQIADMVKEFFDMPSNMDTNVLANIKTYADGLNIPLWIVIQNILISDFARKQARVMVEGANPRQLLPEFTFSTKDDGTKEFLTGSDLFKSLVEMYKQEHISEQIRRKRLSEGMRIVENPY